MNQEPQRNAQREPHRAEDVRQGEIILRSRRHRAIFAAGLVGCIAVALILAIAGYR